VYKDQRVVFMGRENINKINFYLLRFTTTGADALEQRGREETGNNETNDISRVMRGEGAMTACS